MADDIRVTGEPGALGRHEHADQIAARTDTVRTLDAHPDRAPVPDEDPDAAREAINRTRDRMSGTIDEIEEALVRKRARLERRMDILAPVREDPVRTLGIVFGAGLLLGLLTGGDDEDDRQAELLDADARAEMWENRARRLLRIAQTQEDEVETLRAESLYDDGFDDEEYGEEWPEDEDLDHRPSLMERARSTLGEQIAGLAAQAVQQMLASRRR